MNNTQLNSRSQTGRYCGFERLTQLMQLPTTSWDWSEDMFSQLAYSETLIRCPEKLFIAHKTMNNEHFIMTHYM